MSEQVFQLRNRVRERRREQKLTIPELARRSRVSPATIKQVERDRGYRPTSDVMIRLSGALGLRFEDLFWSESSVDGQPAEAVA